MQILQKAKTYDVCIVGSGAGGGMAAKVLAEAGAETVMLEAGQPWAADKDGAMFTWNYDSPRRGAGSRARPFGEFDGCIGGWDIEGEPYTVAAGEKFMWFRARMLGGRTNHWGRISLRFGPRDFKARSRDGLGDDWPIGYDDIKPYYDKLDRFVGLFGVDGGHGERARRHLPAAARAARARAADQEGLRPARDHVHPLAPVDPDPAAERPRRPATTAASAAAAAPTHSNFSTPSVLLPPALATGKLTIVTGAMAREVLTNDEGLATGVSYVDTATGQEQRGPREDRGAGRQRLRERAPAAELEVDAPSERPRQLERHGRPLPDGHARHRHGRADPGARGRCPPTTRTASAACTSTCRGGSTTRSSTSRAATTSSPGGGRDMPGCGFMSGIQRMQGGGYGAEAEGRLPPALRLDRLALGPRRDDPQRGQLLRDRPARGRQVGHPGAALPLEVVRARAEPGAPHERDVRGDHRQDGRQGSAARCPAAHGATTASRSAARSSTRPAPRAWATTRAPRCSTSGARPTTARTSSWPTAARSCRNAHKNMTWTILALSMRTGEHIVEERSKGNL